MELDALITDLALILIVAGVVTLLFKKLKQPVVLGYIVAGFLVGPNFVFFPTIVDEGDINLWAELGIIVLLFSLGLEFSFKKLFQVGASAVLTALVVVSGMMLAYRFRPSRGRSGGAHQHSGPFRCNRPHRPRGR